MGAGFMLLHPGELLIGDLRARLGSRLATPCRRLSLSRDYEPAQIRSRLLKVNRGGSPEMLSRNLRQITAEGLPLKRAPAPSKLPSSC